ncbi:MarR family protein [Raineyella antarctica]|uniref:MarR family protein n=1 Tax=Raineyella antarctica TaxID=1577474 RepID=A0A1G6GJF9_9ACTN|nr:MarR family transcriptional regulator [Raineyella antarctica]SDB82080.1 MarR family protein [Raineyella antarctica]
MPGKDPAARDSGQGAGDDAALDAAHHDAGAHDPRAVDMFIERLGAFLETSGMPRIAARAFAAVLIDDDGRMTAAELADRLTVSPAAVSHAMAYLQHVGLTRKERDPGSRRDIHVLVSEDWYMAMVTRRQIFDQMEQLFAEGSAAAGGPNTAAGHRLQVSQEMSRFMTNAILEAAARWETRRAELERERTTG